MKLRFVASRPEAGGVTVFMFEPLGADGSSGPVAWLAGQSIRLEIPLKPYGTAERRFTIAAAPYEGKIVIATRPSTSNFKRSLYLLQPGDEINGYAVEGDFVWSDDSGTSTSGRPKLLLAGGIGITPFYAMLKDRARAGKSLAATLLYTSRGQTPDDFPFHTELSEWAADHAELTVHYLATGRLSPEVLDGEVPEWPQAEVYLSGPSRMVDDLTATLLARGLPKDQLKRDWFTGNLPEDLPDNESAGMAAEG